MADSVNRPIFYGSAPPYPISRAEMWANVAAFAAITRLARSGRIEQV